MNQKAHVACDFNRLIETEGLPKVTDIRVHFKKSGNVSETVQDRDVAFADSQ